MSRPSRRGGHERAVQAAVVGRGVLGQEGGRTGVLAGSGEPLHHAQAQKQDRRQNAHGFEGGQSPITKVAADIMRMEVANAHLRPFCRPCALTRRRPDAGTGRSGEHAEGSSAAPRSGRPEA